MIEGIFNLTNPKTVATVLTPLLFAEVLFLQFLLLVPPLQELRPYAALAAESYAVERARGTPWMRQQYPEALSKKA